MSGLPTPSRSRTKTSDLSEIFRSSHASRHTTKATPPSSGSPPASSAQERPTSLPKARRSMLPFLGRKKAAEQAVAPPLPSPRKMSNASGIPGPSALPKSFGNGQTVVTISPPEESTSRDPGLPSTLPPLNVSSPSLGSKFAAHFSPLRSPSKSQKLRHSLPQKSVAASTTQHVASLSPPATNSRAASLESQNSGTQSRSSTPRPLQQQTRVVTYYPDEEDYSDLFTLPKPSSKASKAASKLRPLPLEKNSTVSQSKSLELSPASPTPPSSPRMQFPIPPSNIGRPSRASTDRTNPRRSREASGGESASRRSSGSIKPPSAKVHHPASVATELEVAPCTIAETPSLDERDRLRAVSEGDSPRTAAFKQSALAKPSCLKRPASFQAGVPSKAPTGPPSLPLPSPPSNPPTGPLPSPPATTSSPLLLSITSRVTNPTSRPRASTLSGMSPTTSPRNPPIVSPDPSAPIVLKNPPHIQCGKFDGEFASRASPSELRDALTIAKLKYDHLQDYVQSITKNFEEEKAEMSKTIEALQREARKRTREIEGLRWLVIHNGAVGDIDAAANLARSSEDDSTQDDNPRSYSLDTARAPSPSKLKRSNTLPDNLSAPPGRLNHASELLPSHSSEPRSPAGLGFNFLHTSTSTSTLELPNADYSITNSATSSRSSLSLPGLTPSTTSSLSAIPEQPSGDIVITRAERQRMKEERRASRALRRISASSVASTTSVASAEPHAPLDDDKFLDPQSMDDVLEKLRPFGST
ncbi:hypothetical protein BV22DRAFT_161070 [Leucogyrophana mollusca]|uniref:Uncharacterized protein n=1 Tax=Leucogyrophana mollusca TaxID=85980 RepID=A0ACB8BUP2_9AGAM|nr:hypothetical protein BV22DRAFT_161070 [Leucogyrophana mollusca]